MEIVGPVLGLLGIITSIIFTRRVNQRFDRELRSHEAELRHSVDIKLQQVRGDVERDLKNHEVRLRVAAEFRLKMLDRMLMDVADFRSKLGAAIGATFILTHEVEPRGGRSEHAAVLLREAQKCFAALSGAGPFMPAELQDAVAEIANDFLGCLRDVVNWSDLQSREERHARCVQTNWRMTEISQRSMRLFGDWQAAQFRIFTSALDQISANADLSKSGLIVS